MVKMENKNTFTKVVELFTFQKGVTIVLIKNQFPLRTSVHTASVIPCVRDGWDFLVLSLQFLRWLSDFLCAELDGAIRSAVKQEEESPALHQVFLSEFPFGLALKSKHICESWILARCKGSVSAILGK